VPEALEANTPPAIPRGNGSEYPALVIPLLTQHDAMLQRNLVYTGTTRPRPLSVILSDLDALPASFDQVHPELIGEAGWIANPGHMSPLPGVISRTLSQGKS
jgi:hypothetical protein